VCEQHFQAAYQLALFAAAHALDFLGNVLDVGSREHPGPQQRSLLVGPAVEIAFI
jgi:hypothetical protein